VNAGNKSGSKKFGFDSDGLAGATSAGVALIIFKRILLKQFPKMEKNKKLL
jgi:hypothetical protein